MFRWLTYNSLFLCSREPHKRRAAMTNMNTYPDRTIRSGQITRTRVSDRDRTGDHRNDCGRDMLRGTPIGSLRRNRTSASVADFLLLRRRNSRQRARPAGGKAAHKRSLGLQAVVIQTGDMLVFFRRLKNDPDVGKWITAVHIINVDGTGLHPLSDGTYTDFNPTWTRDGKNTPLWNRKTRRPAVIHNWICEPSVSAALPTTGVIVYRGGGPKGGNVDVWLDEDLPATPRLHRGACSPVSPSTRHILPGSRQRAGDRTSTKFAARHRTGKVRVVTADDGRNTTLGSGTPRSSAESCCSA